MLLYLAVVKYTLFSCPISFRVLFLLLIYILAQKIRGVQSMALPHIWCAFSTAQAPWLFTWQFVLLALYDRAFSNLHLVNLIADL